MSRVTDKALCKICRRRVVVVQNHTIQRGDPSFYTGIGPRREAVHEGDEAGRKVVSVNPRTLTHLKVRLHERCLARKERVTGRY